MSRADRQAQGVVDALGFQLMRELVGRPDATEAELRRIVKAALESSRRRVEVKIEIQPYEDEKERIERLLDWLRSGQGGSNA